LTGTARYASINSHNGEELSRRDDIEAIGYLIVFLATGSLPWMDLLGDYKDQKYKHIMDSKI
jgi:serine/threonine protein kinase